MGSPEAFILACGGFSGLGDASIGTLIEGLRARGLEQNTIRLVYGDHGEAFEQFDYDPGTRVPIQWRHDMKQPLPGLSFEIRYCRNLEFRHLCADK